MRDTNPISKAIAIKESELVFALEQLNLSESRHGEIETMLPDEMPMDLFVAERKVNRLREELAEMRHVFSAEYQEVVS